MQSLLRKARGNTDAWGKITYDLATQISESDLPGLRSQVLVLLKKFAPGPKPVRVQLCVCLAILAIQMQTWKDVLSTVVASLGNDVTSHACILDFLRVLPEEVTEGRKITLSVCGSKCCGAPLFQPRFSAVMGSA
jgi:transportin-3